VTLLKNQMSLLDKDNLDHIEGRMQTFLPKLNQAMEKKTHATDSELDKKVPFKMIINYLLTILLLIFVIELIFRLFCFIFIFIG
jgi:hypothetical protein